MIGRMTVEVDPINRALAARQINRHRLTARQLARKSSRVRPFPNVAITLSHTTSEPRAVNPTASPLKFSEFRIMRVACGEIHRPYRVPRGNRRDRSACGKQSTEEKSAVSIHGESPFL